MKKVLVGFGIVGMLALGVTPVSADPVVQAVEVGEAVTASPEAVLSVPEPTVTTTAAPVVPVTIAGPVSAPVALPAPVVASPAPVEVTEPVAAPVAPVEPEYVLAEDGTNPECAEQSMQTGPDGSCLITECPVAGQTMDADGNCAATKNDYGQDLTPEVGAGTVELSEQSEPDKEQDNGHDSYRQHCGYDQVRR